MKPSILFSLRRASAFQFRIFKEPGSFLLNKYPVSCVNKLQNEQTRYLYSFGHQQQLLKIPPYHKKLERTISSEKAPSSPENEDIVSQMNIKLLNENVKHSMFEGFLSWCRNAYISTAVSLAILSEATTEIGQTAGAVAVSVAGMNVFWGTTNHVINLLRLRQATGMSSFILFLNISGAMLHCCLWLMVIVCFLGYADEKREAKDVKTPSLTSNEDSLSEV